MREKSLTFGDFLFTLKALLLCAVPLFRSSSSDLAADYNVSLCGQNGNPAAYGALYGDEVSLHSLQLQKIIVCKRKQCAGIFIKCFLVVPKIRSAETE